MTTSPSRTTHLMPTRASDFGRRLRAWPRVALVLTVISGCSERAEGVMETPTDSTSAESAHLYALQTFVYGVDDTVLSYVALTEDLSVKGELSLGDAREFPGYAFIAAVDGKLLLSSGEEPAIIQFDVKAKEAWEERGKLSFANYGVPSYGAGFERHWFLDKHAAYLTHEVTSRIVWDPSTMEIIGVEEDTSLESERDGLVLDSTFNRPPSFYEGPVLKPFYYRDEDWYRFGGNTPIAIYDPKSHQEQAIIDVPCPALEVMSQDEDGNTYFSPWTYGPAMWLFDEGPKPCIRRIGSDSRLDEEWAPELSEWTGGRPVHVFRYVGSGKAIASVLHVDEVSGDFSAGYDEDLALELDNHWRLWWFDLEAEKAALIEGVEAGGSGFNLSILDDRAFLFAPNAEWSETTVLEVDDSGRAERRFSVQGVANNWVKLR